MFEFEHRQGESAKVAEFEHRQGESAKVAGSHYTKKRKRQIEVNGTWSFKVKKFKWNGTIVYPSDEIYNGENRLASTQRWRKLLFNNVPPKNKLLTKSNKFFRDGVNVFLYGIDKCAENPAQWSEEDTNTFYNKIMGFFNCWMRRLLRKNKCEWVANDTNQVNILTSVYQEALEFIMFSAAQKKAIDSKFKELNDLKDTFPSMEKLLKMFKDQEINEAKKQAEGNAEKLKRSSCKTLPTNNPSTQVYPLVMLDGCLQDKEEQLNDVKSSFPSMETPLKVKDQELSEAKKQADGNAEKLKSCSFKTLPTSNPSTQVYPLVMLDGPRQGKGLQDKEKQLNELKQQLDWVIKKQKETEAELTETLEQLQSFVAKSREMTKTRQKDMIKRLSEIQTLLLMANPNYRPSCQIENESLSKEEKMFQDIKALIEYMMQSVRSDNNCEKNTTKSALETNSSSASLTVSEYEMHLVTQIAAFLKVTPFPVSSHSIYSYVANIDNRLDLQFVESLLRKFPSFF